MEPLELEIYDRPRNRLRIIKFAQNSMTTHNIHVAADWVLDGVLKEDIGNALKNSILEEKRDRLKIN